MKPHASFLFVSSLAACSGEKADSGFVEPGGHARGFEVGDEPLDFTLPTADGGEVSLSDFAGQRIVIVGSSGW